MASKIDDPSPRIVPGSAGETHQVAGDDDTVLTTQQGIPISDDQNTLKAGRRGPSLLVAEGRLNSKGRAAASRAKSGRGLTTVPIFLLVPQVKLRKRLYLERDAERAIDGVPGRIVAGWA